MASSGFLSKKADTNARKGRLNSSSVGLNVGHHCGS